MKRSQSEENSSKLNKNDRINKFLHLSGGTVPTRAVRVKLESTPIDDGTVNEFLPPIRPDESPRSVVEKRYKRKMSM